MGSITDTFHVMENALSLHLPSSVPPKAEKATLGAYIITNTILVVPCYKYSLMVPRIKPL